MMLSRDMPGRYASATPIFNGQERASPEQIAYMVYRIDREAVDGFARRASDGVYFASQYTPGFGIGWLVFSNLAGSPSDTRIFGPSIKW
jgi:hypothetical protein